MRTERVSMFFVHYLTEIENRPLLTSPPPSENQTWETEAISFPFSQGTILHYRDEEETIYGKVLNEMDSNSLTKDLQDYSPLSSYCFEKKKKWDYREVNMFLDEKLMRKFADRYSGRLRLSVT